MSPFTLYLVLQGSFNEQQGGSWGYFHPLQPLYNRGQIIAKAKGIKEALMTVS